jgi:hypothetical protein
LWVVDTGNHRVMKYDNISGSQSTSSISTGSNTVTLDTFTTTFTSNNSLTGNKLDVQKTTSNPTSSNAAGTSLTNYFTVETNTPGLLSARTIQMSYSDVDISGLDESTLQINRFSEGVWSVLTTTINTITNTLTAITPGFSTFVISGSAPTTSSAGGGGGGNNCDMDGFGNNTSLRVYQVSYDIDTYQVLVNAYSTCGSISAKMITSNQQSILGLSTEQLFVDQRIAVYSGYLDKSDETFRIILENNRGSFDETFYITDKSIIRKYSGITGYTSQQQGTFLVPEKQVPVWIKNNAKWWADGSIDDSSFTQGLQYLIKEKIMNVESKSQKSGETTEIPSWIKNNAKWWADGSIDESSFISGIEYLVKEGIISVN